MTRQLELIRPAAVPAEVGELLRILDERPGWLHADRIYSLTGWSDRTIRELAAASGGRVLSGQRGYSHIRHQDPEEIKHASQWLISQGREMIRRGVAIRREAHRLIA